MMISRQSFVALLLACTLCATTAFMVHNNNPNSQRTTKLFVETQGKGFGVLDTPVEDSIVDEEMDQVEEEDDDLLEAQVKGMDTANVKSLLLDLLPSMMGTPEDFKKVETYVNTLEDRYTPMQTLSFLNMAMAGEWQLLFSTNLASGPRPNFRLRELIQRIDTKALEGNVTNIATWDLASEDDGNFDSTGTFSVVCSYSINQGARMVVDLKDHLLQPARGSKIPKDVEALVGLLHRAMPTEMFDPNDHAMDTTYLDTDLRIVRMTGPRFEGIRGIFIRRGSMEINPTGSSS